MNDLHPDPQFGRDRWTDLRGTWRFAFDDDDKGIEQRWFSQPSFDDTIEVPYPPESKLSGVHDKGYHPLVWYAREIRIPELGAGDRLMLRFGAVDYRATVWVDGARVGEHEGGHISFGFDITDALDPSRTEHLVVVRAEDLPTDNEQPRGKQVSGPEPTGVFYDRTTGIWQPVWLEVVPALHVTDLTWIPDLGATAVRMEVVLSAAPIPERQLEVRLSRDGVVIAEQAVTVSKANVGMTIDLEQTSGRNTLTWSPENPRLVDAEVVLAAGDGMPEDRVRSYFGLRSVGYRDGLFLLNGKPYYLRMALEQGFWPDSHLAAPSPEALRREVELVKELGFNGVRIHQKVEDPRFLYWCDRLGLLVWGEYANAFAYSTNAVERTTSEWTRVIRRDRSHPSIVAWVPLNESWGVPDIAESAAQRDFATALYHLTKALDPTRPVISNDGWEHTVSDIWAVHDYAPVGESIRRRYGTPEALHRTLHRGGPGRRKVMLLDEERQGQPVMLTEFGGLSYAPEEGQKWFGYGTVADAEALRDRFEELVDAILGCEDIAGFCYTQLTDTQHERNGLLTEDREPKLPVDVVRQIVTRPSRSIPAEDVDAYRRAARGRP